MNNCTKRLLPLALVCLWAHPVVNANPYEAVHQVQLHNEQRQAAEQAERARIALAKQLQAQEQAQAHTRQRQALEQQAQRRAAQAASERNAEVRRQRTREERFEDQARALALEDRRLEVEAKKAKVARSQEFIDAELRERAAKTDVVQSQADATRQVSTGVKAQLESTGEAELNRSKKWFE